MLPDWIFLRCYRFPGQNLTKMVKKTDKLIERAALVDFLRLAPNKLKMIKKSGTANFTPDERASLRFVGAYLARKAVHPAAGRKSKPYKLTSSGSGGASEDFSLFAKLAAQSITHRFTKQNVLCFERGLEIIKRNLESLANRQAGAAAARQKLKEIMRTDESRRALIRESQVKSARTAVGKRDEDKIDRAAGGFARRDALTAARRSEIASQAAKARWARASAGRQN